MGLNNLFNSITHGGINKKDSHGDTRLYNAVRQGNITQVRKLLRSGANPNIKNAQGLTPLHQAAYWGETFIMEELLRAGADPQADNGQGWTPLHSAALSGGMKMRKESIAVLRAHGAKDDTPDHHGWTAADYMKVWEQDAEAAAKLKALIAADLGRPPEQNRRQPRPPHHFPKH